MHPHEIQAAWQSQPSQMNPLTADRLRRTVRRFKRDRLMSLAGLPFLMVVPLVFGAAAIFGEIMLCRIGCAIIAASFACTTYRIIRTDWAGGDPTADCASHYRARLIRRRDALRSFPYWSSLPAAPGVAIATLGWLLAEPSRWFDATVAAAFWVGLQIALWANHSSIVGRLQKDIDLLDAA
jgi:hypothetical protein